MGKRFLSVHDRGNLTLPADIRRQYRLDEPGVQIEVVTREGVIELHPHVAVPADQAWFWTPSWQGREREASEDVRQGRVVTYHSDEEFLQSFE